MFNFNNKTALITGGTRGIGLSIGLLLSSLGAQCILTYRWGAEDENDIINQFSAINAKKPLLIQADVVDKLSTEQMFSQIKVDVKSIDIFISNVSNAVIIKDFDDYSLRNLKKSISYGAWPLYEYTFKIKETFGNLPRYIIGISSTGPDYYSYGYDYVAASKVVLETLCKYMTYRLKNESTSINIVRSRAVRTKSLEDTFGGELIEFAEKLVPNDYWIKSEEVAGTVVALCSGLLDKMKGQIITVDRGTSFFDNIMDLYTRRKKLAIFN